MSVLWCLEFVKRIKQRRYIHIGWTSVHDHRHKARFHDVIPVCATFYGLFDVEGDTPFTLSGDGQGDIDQFLLTDTQRLARFRLVEKTKKGIGLGRIVLAQLFGQRHHFIEFFLHLTHISLLNNKLLPGILREAPENVCNLDDRLFTHKLGLDFGYRCRVITPLKFWHIAIVTHRILLFY